MLTLRADTENAFSLNNFIVEFDMNDKHYFSRMILCRSFIKLCEIKLVEKYN